MIKLQTLLESLDDWKEESWIHYSEVNYLKIKETDSQSGVSGDPNAIYSNS